MFFSIANNRAVKTVPIEKPWEYTATSVPADIKPGMKAQYRKWCMDPNTTHAFISGCEGLDPNRRICTEEGNPVHKMHALVADFDARNPAQDVEDLKSGSREWPSEYPPAWVADSFSEGHLRAVWLFESPVLIANAAQFKKFIQLLVKKIRLDKWFYGFETTTIGDPSHYYQIGTNWRAVDATAVIPSSLLTAWLYEVSKSMTLDKQQYSRAIPIEKVAEAVELRYPGRWTGPFVPGARGVRFWDEDATDVTGAVVMEHGMMAFSGEQAFLPWAKLLGQKFVDQFEADRIAPLMDKTLFCEAPPPGEYWIKGYDMQDPEGWQRVGTRLMQAWLEEKGFDSTKKKGETISEVSRVMSLIAQKNRVHRALPFLHHPQGVLQYKGSRILNTSRVKALDPAPEGMYQSSEECLADCPFLWKFLHGFLELLPTYYHPYIQLQVLLSWMKLAYEGAYTQRPVPGQVLFLAGNVSKGKTFFLIRILGPLLGGESDASAVLVENKNFTASMVEAPVAWVDDGESANDHAKHMSFSTKIKKMVANPQVRYEQKFQNAGDVPWLGRVVIGLNEDEHSNRMLPDLDGSVRDKIIFLRTAPKRDDDFHFFRDRYKNEETIRRELPAFARFLISFWNIPTQLKNVADPRYGIFAFKHPKLLNVVRNQGPAREVFETLVDWAALQNSSPTSEKVKVVVGDDKKDRRVWEGTSTQLYQELSATHTCIVNKWTPRQLAACLGILSTRTNITRIITSDGGSHKFAIPLKGLAMSNTGEELEADDTPQTQIGSGPTTDAGDGDAGEPATGTETAVTSGGSREGEPIRLCRTDFDGISDAGRKPGTPEEDIK